MGGISFQPLCSPARSESVLSRAESALSTLARLAVMAASTAWVLIAYGRSSVMRCWALFSLAPATIFIARVIFCVDWMLEIRFRMALSDGTDYSLSFVDLGASRETYGAVAGVPPASCAGGFFQNRCLNATIAAFIIALTSSSSAPF